jgi:flagellar FliJ protein
MNTAIQTLNKVVELAQKRRDEALGQMAQLQREMTQAHAQVLHHHRQFMHKIDHAAAFQRGVLGQRQAQIDQAQQRVHVTERDLAGLRRYTERKVQALLHSAQRQEQKQTDEMALSIYLRQRLARTAITPKGA